VIERLDVVVDEAAAEQVDEEDNESEIAAGPISIAVDLNEAPAETASVAGGS
jgi:exoribonuclease-2